METGGGQERMGIVAGENYSGDNYPRWEISGGNCLGAIVLGWNFQLSRGIPEELSGGNCPGAIKQERISLKPKFIMMDGSKTRQCNEMDTGI